MDSKKSTNESTPLSSLMLEDHRFYKGNQKHQRFSVKLDGSTPGSIMNDNSRIIEEDSEDVDNTDVN
jgi:hypothetical protein